MKNRSLTHNEFEEQLFQFKEKVGLLERRLSLKADEVVFTMAVSHRKQIDQLKDEVFQLREELKQVKKQQKNQLLDDVVRKQRTIV
ncbi:hypothetical protein H0266_03260 [Halobacillus locisalis]|uniref:Uncharacterized protein n=1 Tax=Halobacillus locisalis TaxID=220753 RepID=A0A838CP31_9BACI|nr:hypothetical protein [Halobacillus locisalis]MBA2173912.1 hypothetical protein [Halobacillus locisalis]